jgi:hypothetical protein
MIGMCRMTTTDDTAMLFRVVYVWVFEDHLLCCFVSVFVGDPPIR